MSALRPLLSGIVDYAGLFPPAGLDMAAAVQNYADYRHEPASWMLGRFVVPVARLGELSEQLDAIALARDSGDEWEISALLGGDIEADLAAIDAFNEREMGRARVDSLEGKLGSTAAIANVAGAVGDRFACFIELPLEPDPAPLVKAIAEHGLSAKVRTGGVAADAFPAPEQIVRFMRRCAAERVAFKATAGLHHPVRAEYRLTYASDAPRGLMYGYLNVFLTAALLGELDDTDAIALLTERDPNAIHVTRDLISWNGHELRPDQAGMARELVATSFGSCSFREPVDELRTLFNEH